MKKTPQQKAAQAAFLAAFEERGTIRHAAEAADISRQSHYNWLEKDPTYPERFEAARAQAIDALEREAVRRAIEGTEEPVGWYQGKPGGYVRKYSDVLLIFLLKGALPSKYRERYSHEVAGKDGGPIELADARSKVADLLTRISERGAAVEDPA